MFVPIFIVFFGFLGFLQVECAKRKKLPEKTEAPHVVILPTVVPVQYSKEMGEKVKEEDFQDIQMDVTQRDDDSKSQEAPVEKEKCTKPSASKKSKKKTDDGAEKGGSIDKMEETQKSDKVSGTKNANKMNSVEIDSTQIESEKTRKRVKNFEDGSAEKLNNPSPVFSEESPAPPIENVPLKFGKKLQRESLECIEK